MKKIIIAVLMLVVSLCLVVSMIACDKAKVKLNKEAFSVEKYKSVWVNVEYDGNKELTWSSEDASIAVVDGGMVTGVEQGQTKIIVKAGSVKAECLITVTPEDPEKYDISFEETKLNMFVDESVTLKPLLTYDNVPLVGGSFEFSTDSENISVDELGVVTASSLGTAVVTVNSEIDGNKLSATVEINVVDIFEVVIQQKNVVLYPYATYEGENYDNSIICTANILERGQAIAFDKNAVVWSVAENQDVITVDKNGLVTAHNGGIAKLYASYSVGGKNIVGFIDVEVLPVEVNIPNVVLDAGLSTPFVPNLNDIVGVDEEITKIIVNANGMDKVEVFPENGKYDMSLFRTGDASIALVTRNLAYTFNSVIYDGIINTISDMKVLLSAEKGSYKFASDIDMSEYTDNNGVWVSNANFSGTIDGGEHVIKGFKTSTGLFKSFNGGEIKNIAFTGVETIGTIGVFAGEILYYESKSISIDNIFVSNKSNSGGWYVGLIGRANLMYPYTISNSIVVTSPTISYGAIAGQVGSLAVTIDNCYLINTVVYRKSLNTDLSDEEQKNLHDPKTNDYVTYTNFDEAYEIYSEEEFSVSGFVNSCFGAERKVVLISNENVEDLLNATDGIYQLVEDIDMLTAYTANNGVWTSTAIFNGVLDGQGHKITNFKTSTGLFKEVGGTVKNIAILDAQLIGEVQVGVLSKQASLDLVIDNVIFTVSSINITTWIGGSTLFGEYKTPNTVRVSVKNSLLWNRVNTATIAAQTTWEPANVIEVFNSYLVSSGDIINYESCGHGKENHITGTYKKYSTFDALVLEYLDGEIDNASDFVKDFIKESGNVKEIRSSNISDLLNATQGVYLIMEDIDMSTAYTANNGVWTTTAIFNGVLDGQGHKITNFKTNTGLFKRADGTIKNLAILDATLTGACASLLATSNTADLIVDNVIFTVGKVSGNAWTGGSALVETYNTGSITVKNSILSNPTTHQANLGGIGCGGIAVAQIRGASSVVTFENTYLVGNSAYIVYYDQCDTTIHEDNMDRITHIDGTYSAYSDLSALAEAYENNEVTNVSDEIKEFIDSNINKE